MAGAAASAAPQDSQPSGRPDAGPVVEPAAGTPSQTPLPAASAAPAWHAGDTVRELLRADAQAALATHKLAQVDDWLAPPRQPLAAPPAGAFSDRLGVLAIYGVGKSLHADIFINGRLTRYQAGRVWPLGGAPTNDADRYALLSIDLPCVRLRKDGAVRTECVLAEGTHD